jgi:hypothetical protein
MQLLDSFVKKFDNKATKYSVSGQFIGPKLTRAIFAKMVHEYVCSEYIDLLDVKLSPSLHV